ncbi:SEC-C metal-binding domain-containing protein [Pontiellaceae bacterium B12219]|nr:SEC-C metal-binding domain-containing protein [Pontiellaceae bacterium B12219]
MRDELNYEAIQVLRDNWEETLPILFNELKEYEEGTLADPLIFTGLLLCGELEEVRAFEPILAAVIDQPDGLFDDLSIFQVAGILVCCCGGREARLLEIFEDEKQSRYARMVAFRSLILCRMLRTSPRHELDAWLVRELEKIERSQVSEISDFVIVQAMYFVPDVAERVGSVFFGDAKEVGMGFLFDEARKATPEFRQDELKRLYRPLGTADEELAEIYEEMDYIPEDEMEYLLNHPEELLGILPSPDEDDVEMIPAPNTGRNESCLCGSGKKFKKCCINKPFIAVPQTAVDWTGKPITKKNFLPNCFLEAGYLHAEAGDELAQMAAWLLFAGLLENMVPSHINCPADIERKQIFCGYEQINSWMSHFLKSSISLILKNERRCYVEHSILWINEQFVKASPNLREQMVLARGFLYSDQEDKEEEAIRDFRQVLEWRSENLVAISMLAVLYLDRQDEPDVEAAREILEQGIKLAEDEADKARFRQQLEDMKKKYGGVE